MTLDDLKNIRLVGKRPEKIINLSLCHDSEFREPVIEIPRRNNFDGLDFRSLHRLAADIHYWNRVDDVIRLIEKIREYEPHSVYTVDHKHQICTMVYWKGQSMFDDQSFLYDWEDHPYARSS